MTFCILNFVKRRYSGLLLLIAAAFTFILISCVSYDAVEEGSMNTVYQINGASVIMDEAVDKFVVLGIRNDGAAELQVKVRAISGEIGYDVNSGSVSGFGNSSSNLTRAAFLTGGNNASIGPGEEINISVFLKNWYLANKNFKLRMEVVIDDGVESHALNIYTTQDDIFDNAKKTFQDNKLGKNDPSRNGAVHIGAGNLPGTFVLTIPLN